MSIRKGKAYPYGIHVKDMKELCADSPIVKMPAPKKVYISMSQHIGAPAIPIVNVGDKVKLMETSPLSKTKRWRVVTIIEKAK